MIDDRKNLVKCLKIIKIRTYYILKIIKRNYLPIN